MKERFEGANAHNLVDAIKRQEFASNDAAIASALISHGELHEFAKGHKLIVQDGEDNDIYLLVAGSVSIVVNENEIDERKAGQHVGEMAAIEPAQKRAADVVAHDTLVALKISSAAFNEIGARYPQVWLPIARELSRRLFRRNRLIAKPNEAPKLFIMSSTEALDIARQVQSDLHRDVLGTVWPNGVFFAGGYPLEDLERWVAQSDFGVAIAQPDDIVTSRGISAPALRDNVLFELGLFMGKLGRHRTILIHPRVANLKLPSDLQGLTLVSYEPRGTLDDLPTRLGAACHEIRKIVQRLGVFKVIG